VISARSRPAEDEVVLITGATDGHGEALAGALAAGGTTVLLHGRDTVPRVSVRASSACAPAWPRLSVLR
jgi:NAD(P)-dependent dehydrogenase (short-subunit alcohol dehydrogenase family)